MKPKDFVMWVNGYNERLLEQHEIARRVCFLLFQHSKRTTSEQFYKEYWPLPGEDKNKLSASMQKRIEKINSRNARRD
jgi:hypothetical protein